MIDHNETVLTKTVAMPADTNPNGDIFGGWLLSQMDVAGGILAKKIANTCEKQIELIVKSQKQKISKINKYLPNTDKMEGLNLVPKISLSEALRKTSDFYKKINH